MKDTKRLLTDKEVRDFVERARRSLDAIDARLARLGITAAMRSEATAVVFGPGGPRRPRASPRVATKRPAGAHRAAIKNLV